MELIIAMLQMSVDYMTVGAVNQIVTTLNEFVTALRTIAIPVATVMLIVAGIMWFTMGEQGPARAKKVIIGVVIGIVIIFAADTIATWLQSKSSF